MDDWTSDWAKRVSEWRIIPRVLLISAYIAFGVFSAWVTAWFMDFPFNELENQTVALAIAGFPAAILAVMTGVLGTVTKHYFTTGKGNGV
jgi:ABC-type multidrug transport system fused ATPase/permease subunit